MPAEFLARITVVETLSYQVLGERTEQVPTSFSRELNTREQKYYRRLQATPVWQPLDVGWLEFAGALIIRNTEGMIRNTIPSAEEKQATERLYLEVKYAGDPEEHCWEVYSGETMRALPKQLTQLEIRCPNGIASYDVHVIPGSPRG